MVGSECPQFPKVSMLARRDQQGDADNYTTRFWGRRLSHESRSIREITIFLVPLFVQKNKVLLEGKACVFV